MILDLARWPVALLQGAALRFTVPRLQPPPPPEVTVRGDPRTSRLLNLLCLGESTIAGCGARHGDQTLPVRFAEQLATRFDCRVAWRTKGRYGARSRDCLDWCAGLPTDEHDMALVVLGVNDTLRLTRAKRWRGEVQALVRLLGRAGQARVILAGVPPMGHFPALPNPVRGLLAQRSARLDEVLRDLARNGAALHVPMPESLLRGETEVLFAEDRFHPSPLGYQRWAEGLVSAVEEARASEGVRWPI